MTPPADIPEEWVSKLEAYYAGDLSPEAEADLRRRLSGDPRLSGLVAREEALYRHGLQPGPDALAERRRLRGSLGQLERTLAPLSAPAAPRRRRFPFRWLALAAAVLLALSVWWLLRPAEDPAARLATESFFWLPRQENRLGPDDDTPTGPQLYDYQEFDRAYPALREEVAAGTLDSVNLLYAGVAALGADRPAEARELLAALLASGRYPDDAASLHYYLALAELQLGNRAAAEELLTELPDQDPDLTARTGRLLEALRALE